MRMCHFWVQNGSFVMNKIFLVQTIMYYFHLPTVPFHCSKFKKILTAGPELWGCTIFGPKMVHFPQTKLFLENYYIILIYLLAPFIGQNF